MFKSFLIMSMQGHILQVRHSKLSRLEMASSMLLHVTLMSTKLLPTKTSDSKSLCLHIAAHEHICSLQAQSCWHMHSAPPKKSQSLAIHCRVAFVEIAPVNSTLTRILHVPMSWHSKRPHLKMASCWKLSKHLQCSHILHICQSSYCTQWICWDSFFWLPSQIAHPSPML